MSIRRIVLGVVSLAGIALADLAVAQLSEFQARYGDLARLGQQQAVAKTRINIMPIAPPGEIDQEALRPEPDIQPQYNGNAWSAPAPVAQDLIGHNFTQGPSFESYDLNTAASITSSYYTPPDTMGAVGPTQFWTVQNGLYRIHDKVTGVADTSLDVAASAFWPASVDPNDNGGGDPRVRFDRLTDTWILSAFTRESGGNYVIFARSDGPIISSATVFTYYFIHPGTANSYDDGCFMDYPMLATDATSILFGANMFSAGSCGYSVDTSVWVMPRSALPLAGGDVSSLVTPFVGLYGSNGIWTPMPADNYDPTATTSYLVGQNASYNSRVILGTITYTSGTPTLTKASVTISAKNGGWSNGVPYPGVPSPNGSSTWGLDPLGFRPIGGAIVRDGSLWSTMSSSVQGPTGELRSSTTGDRHSVVFFEIDVATQSLVQDGNVYDAVTSVGNDPQHYFMGTVSVNGQGHAAVGFTANNTTTLAPSAAWASRLADDPPGQFGPMNIYWVGTDEGDLRQSFETNPRPTRWGDYSMTTVDPCDDMTFYTIQEYQDNGTLLYGGNWGVAVGRINAPAPVAGSPSPAAITVSTASSLVDVTGTGFYNPPVSGMSTCRIGISASSPGLTVTSVTYNSATSITLDLDTTGSTSGTKTVTITNPDGQQTQVDIEVESTDTIAPAVSTYSPADNATDVSTATDLVLVFDETIVKGTGNNVIKRAADDSVVETIDVTSGQVTLSTTTETNDTVTIDPAGEFDFDTEYYVQIENTVFTDAAGNDYVGIVDKVTWNFTTEDMPAISLAVAAASISEADGPAATTATVSRNGSTTGPLTVNLSSNDTSEASVPASVQIPAGQASATFNIDAVDDALVDGTQTVTITATAAAHAGGSDTVDVTDDETATLTVNISAASFSENGGSSSATVSRNSDITSALTVNLTSDDTGEATVPASVIIAAGQSISPSFTVTGVDDAIADGTQTVTVTATAAAHAGGSDTVNVTDDETATLTVNISAANFSENGGGSSAMVSRNSDTTNPLTVNLASDDTSEATVPATVTIAAGESTSPSFSVSGVDDAIADGTQTVTVTATATAHAGGSDTVDVTDDETATLTVNISAASFSENGGSSSATVSRNSDTTNPLIVNLASDDTSEATVPVSVTIAAGESASPSFTVTGVDDAIVDGTQTVTVTATAAAHAAGSDTVKVTDDDSAALTLNITAASFSENGGSSSATVSRNSDTTNPLIVNLASDDTSEATVPASVTIAAGESASPSFIVTGVDDAIADGTQTITITAMATAHADGSDMVDVTDDDSNSLTVSINDSSMSENGGSSTATVTRNSAGSSLSVMLVSNDTTEATVPGTVTIPTGQSSTGFTVTGVDDSQIDGSQTVTVTASATGFDSGSDTIEVTDDESISLEKMATPATYLLLGDQIQYTYVITNESNVDLDPGLASVIDDKVAVTCPSAAPIAPQAKVICQATHIITQADLDTGFVTNKATADVDGVSSNEQTVTISRLSEACYDGALTIPDGQIFSGAGTTRLLSSVSIDTEKPATLGAMVEPPHELILTAPFVELNPLFDVGRDDIEGGAVLQVIVDQVKCP